MCVFQRNDQIVDDAEDDLGDIDDEEINSYILTEGEATNKAKLWEVLNREYLTLQAERKAREEVEGKKEKRNESPRRTSDKCGENCGRSDRENAQGEENLNQNQLRCVEKFGLYCGC